MHLVVKESILSDTFLCVTSCASEIDIVGLSATVLHRKLGVALVASGTGLDQPMILGKFQSLILLADFVMQRYKVISHL